jgi:Cu-Zn family superoxide dismutase
MAPQMMTGAILPQRSMAVDGNCRPKDAPGTIDAGYCCAGMMWERKVRNMVRSIVTAGAVLLGGMVLAGPALAQDAKTQPRARAVFIDGTGNNIGLAELTGTPQGVLIELDLSGLPPAQWVAFHIHETGSCDPQGGHKSAGGHFNPDGREHGYLAADGPHAGDMPNQYVQGDGTLRAQVFKNALHLTPGDDGISGRALMIHAKPDDYRSQPAGDAGDRIACAVIE